MARNISSRNNAIPPSGTDPFGRFKDETSLNAGDGTSVNEAALGDIAVCFQKIMDDYGIVPNELPDDTVNGFQLVQALKLIPTPDDSVSTVKIQDDAVTPDKVANGTIIKVDQSGDYTGLNVRVLDLPNWDMVATDNISVNHGVTDGQLKIIGVQAFIINDPQDRIYDLTFRSSITSNPSGAVDSITSNSISLISYDFFAGADYNDNVISRGKIRITYVD